MKLNLFSTIAVFNESQLKGYHVVVVDVLRASSTIVHACEKGIERIIPVASVEDVTKLLPTLDRKKTLTGGESDGRKIEGFDLGNSPSEYSARVVRGKTLVFATTNGTVAITKSAPADEIVVGCFLNLSAVVAHVVAARPKNIAILCAGNHGYLALEDFVCGGMIADGIRAATRRKIQMNDGALAARSLSKTMPEVEEVVRSSSHGCRLTELGFEEDLVYCSRVSKYSTVPLVLEGRISNREAARRS